MFVNTFSNDLRQAGQASASGWEMLPSVVFYYLHDKRQSVSRTGIRSFGRWLPARSGRQRARKGGGIINVSGADPGRSSIFQKDHDNLGVHPHPT